MKLEVGKKYTDGRDVVEIKFIDWAGYGWGLTDERKSCRYIETNGTGWTEVIDKPDPGEGWRLLEPDEEVHVGDEWLTQEGRWIATVSEGFKPNQYINLTFRRRTTPQYVPYTWDDREELRGRWFRKKEDKHDERQVVFIDANDSDIIIGGWRAKEFLQKFEWLDGSPCGKKVV
jgi:hypothetical protein